MISLIVTIALIGLFVWAILKLVPMPAQFGQVIIVIAVVCVVLVVLHAFGLISGAHIPRLGIQS